MSSPRQSAEVLEPRNGILQEPTSVVIPKDEPGIHDVEPAYPTSKDMKDQGVEEETVLADRSEPAVDNFPTTTDNALDSLKDKGKGKITEGNNMDELRTATNEQSIPDMESSTATLKPIITAAPNVPMQNMSPIDQTYLDPTPKTPGTSRPPSRSASTAGTHHLHAERLDRSPTRSDAGFDEKTTASEDEREGDSRSEIQSIMDQFGEDGQGPGHEEVMSPRLEFAGPLLGSPVQHPPRKSSLEPINASVLSQSMGDLQISSAPSPGHRTRNDSDVGPAVPPKADSIHSFGIMQDDRYSSADTPLSPALHRPPPPEPEPEPDLPFDFHRFLEQLRHRTADPVAKFLRSFLQEFAKKQWMVHEQVKIISDFLSFITNKMAQCEVWREVSDAGFDNAREGMEKLVMNRLYTQTFSPAIPPPQPIPGSKPRRRGADRPMGPGRRGQHQEDVERDEILAQKVSIYGWVKEQHLDIPPVGESGKRFLILAQQEILKIKTYRAPRDKIICVLNCCKVIFGLLKHSKTDSSADSFMPLLIYVVLQANPEHLVSNVQYILRFRNQEKLGGEAGYYLSSLMGAVQFIENLDRTSLTISDEDFERNVEAAVSAIAEKHQAEVAPSPVESSPPTQLSEKSPPSQHSMEGESSGHRRSTSSNEYEAGDGMDEKAAMSGLLRTIQKPLSSIGRMFSDDPSPYSAPARTPNPGSTPGMTPSPRVSMEGAQPPQRRPSGRESIRNRMTAEDAAARQASAEAAEAQRLQRAEHENVVETLAGMFPDLDREIISDVVTQKEGRVGLAVDACLALSS
ncbi:5d65f865-da2e-4fed-8ae6-1d4662c3637e [Sclerotinia trifoliorum]|uniref:5d65f865-da2e-4fed-8ae6-1d4662c3637e n=1 Tax=Sclerotinia trifoliorum TaxID=28548 RepID=A0A8H2ZUC5_9HELO|nr:5d65f865-da2e-4fed-8ae6-1d4662c3637e [Sclerotinia trifoliorum]